jgi:IMP dehydrogenase
MSSFAAGACFAPLNAFIKGMTMAIIRETITGAHALTFDDVLLQPGHSEVMPGQTNLRTPFAKDIELNIPIISSAMDTVTEARLAIAMAQAGGIGVIHRNLDPERQAERSGRSRSSKAAWWSIL